MHTEITKEVIYMKCQNCGAELPDGAIYCTHCNRLNKKPDVRSRKRAEIIAIVILVIAWFLCLMFFGVKNPTMLFAMTACVCIAIFNIKKKK